VSSGKKTLRQCFVAEVAGVTFSDSDYAPVPKFLNPGPEIFKFENPIPVPTQATIDATEIQQCLNLSSDIYKDSCYCRKWKMTPDPGAFFSQNPGPFFHKRSVFSQKIPIWFRKKTAGSCRSRFRHSGSVITSAKSNSFTRGHGGSEKNRPTQNFRGRSPAPLGSHACVLHSRRLELAKSVMDPTFCDTGFLFAILYCLMP